MQLTVFTRDFFDSRMDGFTKLSIETADNITMKSTESTRWGIHAGKTGNAGSLFLKKHCVALGWAKMGEVEANLKDRKSVV